MSSIPRYFILIFSISITACKSNAVKTIAKNTEPSFYYWKSVFDLSQKEISILKKNRVKTLYVKFFDADWNNETHAPAPKAHIRFIHNSFLEEQKINIVPVVFVTNECLLRSTNAQCDSLAAAILKLVEAICRQEGLQVSEIQTDCDWTALTREKYFRIIRLMQQANSQLVFSATIRMHQVKYAGTTGIPPANRGMLMCYNMGNLKNILSKNSIIDPAELKKYSSSFLSYQLPLDVALPLFEWFVVFRNGQYRGLVQHCNVNEIRSFTETTDQRLFSVIKDTVFREFLFRKGDRLRYEQSGINEIMQCADIIRQNIKDSSFRLTLYHLDSLILEKFPEHELENIFNSMH